MTTRGKRWRYSPHDLVVPLAATLLACGLTGCPGRNDTGDGGDGGIEAGGDAGDVATDRGFVPEDVPMDRNNPDAVDVPIVTDAIDVPIVTDVTDVTEAGTPDPTPTTATLVVSCGTTCKRPLDAVLDMTGTKVFFTAFAPDGQAAVFAVAAAGGPITMLASGGGMNFPLSIAIDETSAPTLYIADLAADSATGTATGAVFTLPAGGGSPTRVNVAGIVGPSGIAVDGANLLLTAQSAAGTAGVYQVGTAGGTATLLSAGTGAADFSELSALTGTTQLVADTHGGSNHTGGVVNVSNGTTVLGGLLMAYPAGLVVSRDGAHFLVAGQTATPGVTWAGIDGSAPTAVPATGNPFVSPTGVGRSRDHAVYVVADELAGTPANGAIFLVQ